MDATEGREGGAVGPPFFCLATPHSPPHSSRTHQQVGEEQRGFLTDTAPSAVIEPLKTTPIWIFHSELDDSVPPPGRPQDDGDVVVKAFEAAGNTAVKYTKFGADVKPAHYIPGHAGG